MDEPFFLAPTNSQAGTRAFGCGPQYPGPSGPLANFAVGITPKRVFESFAPVFMDEALMAPTYLVPPVAMARWCDRFRRLIGMAHEEKQITHAVTKVAGKDLNAPVAEALSKPGVESALRPSIAEYEALVNKPTADAFNYADLKLVVERFTDKLDELLRSGVLTPYHRTKLNDWFFMELASAYKHREGAKKLTLTGQVGPDIYRTLHWHSLEQAYSPVFALEIAARLKREPNMLGRVRTRLQRGGLYRGQESVGLDHPPFAFYPPVNGVAIGQVSRDGIAYNYEIRQDAIHDVVTELNDILSRRIPY